MSPKEDILHIFGKSGAHSAWGIKHCTRVYHLSKELSLHLSLDDEILYIASMLHDIGRYPAYALPNIDHPLRSKGVASNILQRMAFPTPKIPLILEAVETHMYYSEPGRSDEAVYLRDADILDNLGNIGLMRLFSLIGYDDLIKTPEDALERARTFAEALPNKVYTKAGRRLAVKRREEMLRFLSGIKRQTTEYAKVL
ncbi:HD domain-containing protein [Desulfitobacterium sp.]|uniref:HD domain-containing protein n=1 Tax=Desulfitobacterium sp. TaxID=49981 RepID=UPI002B21D7C9|nr:HD domain-containing protein [Desulfitobacterium sp.]MEA4900511.1 HD domain-containing protein [Desulfitobacterium sp.]